MKQEKKDNTGLREEWPEIRDRVLYAWSSKKRKKKYGLQRVHVIVPESDKSLCQMENVIEFTNWSWEVPDGRKVCSNCIVQAEGQSCPSTSWDEIKSGPLLCYF